MARDELTDRIRDYTEDKHRRLSSTSSSAQGGAASQQAAPSSGATSSPPPPPPHPPHPPQAAGVRQPAAAARAPPRDLEHFVGVHSFPNDLVDILTRNGSFAFLEDLYTQNKLFELRNFRLPRTTPKGDALDDFAACMQLVLSLAEKFPRQSLALTRFPHLGCSSAILVCAPTSGEQQRPQAPHH